MSSDDLIFVEVEKDTTEEVAETNDFMCVILCIIKV